MFKFFKVKVIYKVCSFMSFWLLGDDIVEYYTAYPVFRLRLCILFILQAITVNHKMIMNVAAVLSLTLIFVLWA
jgi:hypothetical protein